MKKILVKKNKLLEEWPEIIEDLLKQGGALALDMFVTKGIAQLLLNFSPQRRFRKIVDELRNSSEETKKELQDKVSKEYLKSPEFLSFFAYAIAEATSMRNIEKIKYFKSAIISGMIDIEREKKSYYIYCLSNLPMESLLVLAKIDNFVRQAGSSRISFNLLLGKESFQQADYLMATVKVLESYNLVRLKTPSVETVNYSNYIITYNKFGENFVKFITHYA